MSSDSPRPSVSHPLGWALLAGVVLSGLGWLAGAAWLSSITDTLAGASVHVVATAPDALWRQQLGVALAMGSSAPMGVGVRLAIARVAHRPPSRLELLTASVVVLLGSQVGLGGALFNTARVAVPAALDASAESAEVSIAIEQLALGNWAFAGAAGAAVILGAVGTATAGLERSKQTET